MAWGWIENPDEPDWPEGLEFALGEVVLIRNLEAVEGQVGCIFGYDKRGEGGAYRYFVEFEGEVSRVVAREHLESTGRIDQEKLPPQIVPVLGNGTVVRILDTDAARAHDIVGRLAFISGLWWTDESDQPQGYLVRLPNERETRSLPFDSFDIVEGSTQ